MKSADQKKLELLYEEVCEEGVRTWLAQTGANVKQLFSGNQSAALKKAYQIFSSNVLKSIAKMEKIIENSPERRPADAESPIVADVNKVQNWLKPFLQNTTPTWDYRKALSPAPSSNVTDSKPPAEAPNPQAEAPNPQATTSKPPAEAPNPHALSQSQIEKAKMELDAIKKFTKKIAKTPEIKDLISKAEKALETAKKQNERSKAKQSKQTKPTSVASADASPGSDQPPTEGSPTANTVVAGG
jgi:hypothetical protein